MSAVRYSFHVKRTAAGAPKQLRASKVRLVPEEVPRIARLLALAHKFQGMLDRREVKSMDELARLGRVSRARITQIMDLLMLSPEIQDNVLFAEDADADHRLLSAIAHRVQWTDQCEEWRARALDFDEGRTRNRTASRP